MIITVTLNPAIDKTMTADELVPGQVNRMKTMTQYAGGKGVNVTKLLRELGDPVTGLGFLGGFTGSFILAAMRGIGVDCRYTTVAAPTRTSCNILSADGFVTEILEPGAPVTEEEKEQFLAAFEAALPTADTVVFSGSLPAGLPDDFYARLIRIAKDKGKRTVLDTSGRPLAEGLKEMPFLIKPNVREMEYVMKRPLRTEDDLAGALVRLKQSGIAVPVVSRGKRGMMAVVEENGENVLLRASVPDVHVVNTVGSGDVTIAVLARLLCREGVTVNKETVTGALREAAAYSSANVMSMESGVVPLEEVEGCRRKVRITERRLS